MKRKVNIH